MHSRFLRRLAIAGLLLSTEPAMAFADALPSYLVCRDLPEELVELERAGSLSEAEKWIDAHLAYDAGPGNMLVIERQRLARVRRDFSLSLDDLLKAVRADIPDASEEDIRRWRDAGHLQAVEIDGEARFFRKEPRNLFRLSKDARQRRDASAKEKPAAPQGDPNAVATKAFVLEDRVAALLAEADASASTTPGAMRVRAVHTITVEPGVVPAGQEIRCWMPFPQEYERQRGVRLLSSSHAPTIAPNGIGQRTVFQAAVAGDESTVFRAEYEYTISAYVPKLDAALAKPSDPAAFAEFLAARPPHVDLAPQLRALSAEIVGDETNPLLAAEKIFRWIDANFRYCSEMEYSIMSSVIEKALVERAGDCGIHALLFISLCRAAGIPARWQSGWAMRPGAENMHDWAEFHVEPWGWLPADPSFGLREHDDPRVRAFYFGHIDPFRLVANLDYETEFEPAKTHWRSDNIDNQRGEVEWAGGNLFFDQWKWKMEATYEELAPEAK